MIARSTAALALALGAPLLSAPFALEPRDPARALARLELHGFDVRLVNGFAGHELHDPVIALLGDHLFRISRVVAEPALAKLRAIPVWVGFEDARHEHRCMFYHPSKEWLDAHDYPTELAGGIEVANARNFLSWTLDQPWMVLHELAHGYHHQVLGHGHAGIRAAYGAAKKAGIYDEVLRIGGRKERHYALENDQEYFAEATEAYFGTNDFYPFVRAELKAHDERCYGLLEQIWGPRRRG